MFFIHIYLALIAVFFIHSFYCRKIDVHLIIRFWPLQFVKVVSKTLQNHDVTLHQRKLGRFYYCCFEGNLFVGLCWPSLRVKGYAAERKTNKILTNTSECAKSKIKISFKKKKKTHCIFQIKNTYFIN